MIIGSHVSFKKDTQLLGSLNEALSYGANTFMFYTGAPQNTARYPINLEIAKEAIDMMKKLKIDYSKVIVHAPYIINLANDDEHKYRFAINFLKEEVNRCELLGIKKMVLHPGSHVGLGTEKGIKNIIFALNQVLVNTDVVILIETMAGKGSEIGSNFQEIKQIIDGVNNKENIGVCMDTCHLNDAGYDMTDFNGFLNEFNKIIGINKIKCLHLNDSKNEIGAHKDRHDNIGFGNLGFENIMNIIYNSKLENIPIILETPYVGDYDEDKNRLYPPYKFEIEMLKAKKFNENLKEDIRKYYK